MTSPNIIDAARAWAAPFPTCSHTYEGALCDECCAIADKRDAGIRQALAALPPDAVVVSAKLIEEAAARLIDDAEYITAVNGGCNFEGANCALAAKLRAALVTGKETP